MNIKDKIDIEKDNNNFIKLYKEGIFWRAYNQSCMLFTQYFDNYKVIIKYVKYLKQNIYYCGFPDTILENIKEKCKQIGLNISYLNENEIIIENLTISEIKYEDWENKMIKENAIMNISNNKNTLLLDIKEDIISQIINFPIAESTPLEAFSFLYKIQKQLKN